MERVITVGLQQRTQNEAVLEHSMAELERLVETAGGVVVEAHVQKRDRPDPATFVGKGKVLELGERLRRLKAKTLVFDDELKPGQQQHIEELTQAKVVDRTRLILDIFAQRARTREGQLQVELAQLDYSLPRMTMKFGRFEQQVGGIGTRGPGERKLEVDQRRVRDRIARLRQEMKKVKGEREQQRSVRGLVPMPQVALVGYTNAGKSTLLNALLRQSPGGPRSSQHEVYADDKLFATLDPTTRRVRLSSGRVILVSDTVGFIQKLPTELIAAFRATLEEAGTADLILHVVDASDGAWRDQFQTVIDILDRLGMGRLPRLTAYNKMDCLLPSQKDHFSREHGVGISAAKGLQIKDLLKAIEDRLAEQWIEKEFLIPYRSGARLAQLHDYMDVLTQEPTPEGIRVRVRSHATTLAQWTKLFTTND